MIKVLDDSPRASFLFSSVLWVSYDIRGVGMYDSGACFTSPIRAGINTS